MLPVVDPRLMVVDVLPRRITSSELADERTEDEPDAGRPPVTTRTDELRVPSPLPVRVAVEPWRVAVAEPLDTVWSSCMPRRVDATIPSRSLRMGRLSGPPPHPGLPTPMPGPPKCGPRCQLG